MGGGEEAATLYFSVTPSLFDKEICLSLLKPRIEKKIEGLSCDQRGKLNFM